MGCPVVLKPCDKTPMTALKLAEIFQEAGIPDGALNVVPGLGEEAGQALVNNRGVDKIAFTGSYAVGKHIIQSAGIKRVTLELGGKSPNIILKDADMNAAVEQATFAGLLNQGQACMAGTRTFVHESIYDEFVARIAESLKSKKVGDPLDPTNNYGPQITEAHLNKILSYVDNAKKAGAKLIAGGNRLNRKGFFMEPTAFADCDNNMKFVREEIFGPVMSIQRFKTIEEVVEKAHKEIDKEVDRAAEDAMREVGVVGVPKEIQRYLGELKFRTSYGQNVLKHSTEMAHVAGMIAEEIGADVTVCKTAALLHDFGKALSHKMEGKHHHIGEELAKKYGMSDEIAHAIGAHHDDIEATTPEAVIIRVVDAMSAARPGARNISAEGFAERMRDLENVATSFEGIDKAYAISAGREVRVIVEPKEIDDLSAIKLARDIANKIESTMQYPGTIKVNVIRETRAVEFAK